MWLQRNLPDAGRVLSCSTWFTSSPEATSFSSTFKLLRPRPVGWLWQSQHLQRSEQGMPAWKHSQYFLRQWLLRQAQPCSAAATFECLAREAGSSTALLSSGRLDILGLKAEGFFSRVFLMAMVREFWVSAGDLVVSVVEAVQTVAVFAVDAVRVALAVELDAVALLAVAALLRLHRAQLRRLQEVFLLVAGVQGRA